MKQLIIFLIIIFVVLILTYFLQKRSKYSHDHPILEKIRDNFIKLDPEYGKIPLRHGDSAYTENKAVITICLRDPETQKFYDMNTLMYVALHELAHVISISHGHNDEFKDNFYDLLSRASKAGIYDPTLPIPDTYCGIDS